MSAYVFTLDGLAFGPRARFFRGPVVYHQPERWSEFHPIGHTGVDATIETFLGLDSQQWDCGKDGLFTLTEINKLVAVYTGRIAVVWKTPQDATGINVTLKPLKIEYEDPQPNSYYKALFTLTRRA